MKKKTLFITLLTLLTHSWAQNISGYWQGKIGITKTDSLTVGFFIQQTDSTLQIEADSPDQYTIGLAVKDVAWSDSLLSLKMPTAGASFKGKLSSDGLCLQGTFTQKNRRFPLTLKQGHERKTFYRPQTPQPPFPYTEEEVRIMEPRGKFSLINGTLTLPTERPKALVILISGSGWQDRDESLFGHKPFGVIADALTRQGYAVLRYDDFPQALFAKSTTLDFADGVSLIVDSLSKRHNLSATPIGLLGHSEGSLIAEIVAARDKRIQFIISLGGVAQNTADVLLYQLRALSEVSGKLSSEEITQSVLLSKEIYKTIGQSKTPKQASDKVSALWDRQAEKLSESQRERYNYTPENKRAVLAQVGSPWFFTFFQLTPNKYLKKVTCPLLALGGEKDLQVDAIANNKLFEQYLPENVNHKFIVVPNANHLLQTCNTGSFDEYGEIEETIQPAVLLQITNWLNNLYPTKK